MAGFRRSVFSGRPVEEVFDFASELANVSLVIAGVTKVGGDPVAVLQLPRSVPIGFHGS